MFSSPTILFLPQRQRQRQPQPRPQFFLYVSNSNQASHFMQDFSLASHLAKSSLLKEESSWILTGHVKVAET